MADNPTNQVADTPNSGQIDPRKTVDTPQTYAGKYRSVQELEKGYWETSQEGLRQRDARIRAETERDSLKADLERYSRQAVGPDPLAAAFLEADIPLEAFDARVEAKALNVLQAALKPLMDVQNAETRVSQKYKDWPGLQTIQKELDPDASESYRKLLAVDPEAAMTLGYEAWKPRQQVEQRTPAIDRAAQRAATPPNTQSGGRSEDQSGGMDKAKYQELLQEAVMTGEWMKFNRYRFGNQPWFKRLAEGQDGW